ncbi:MULTISPECIES: DUF2891 domain-containing protein [unclassified Pseudomonas]|uniref:DUF2891 domain-containing protein n=1 Tax=unclassified Pseudomonas TaxID=196821 RepID=UPI000D3B2C02|nr:MULTISPECIES: DUF2891 domain-containing protein [unclassified Pseudomonas]PTT10572.1 DUF2891 domain-containing protein [Pseudomonas sp. HMWF034]PVV71490.1 DUF2891 domain-containing protein [Pseudomonas sp. HMWF011]
MDICRLQSIASALLKHVSRQYPHSQSRVFESATDFSEPRTVHPIFFGCFDWHSSVHAHWLLLRALELVPNSEIAPQIETHFNAQFTVENVRIEASFFSRSAQSGFERPYGWAWLLKLVTQLKVSRLPVSEIWHSRLDPLASLLSGAFQQYLPKLLYPIRSGQHNNTAFALLFALEYAEVHGRIETAVAIRAYASNFFGRDVACTRVEPGGEDFLSPLWQVAMLMQQVLPHNEYVSWLQRFLPEPSLWAGHSFLRPVSVSDRSDGRLAHLDGLNFSRAWCMKKVARSFPVGCIQQRLLFDSAIAHLKTSRNSIHLDYMGEHWLGSFLMLAEGD